VNNVSVACGTRRPTLDRGYVPRRKTFGSTAHVAAEVRSPRKLTLRSTCTRGTAFWQKGSSTTSSHCFATASNTVGVAAASTQPLGHDRISTCSMIESSTTSLVFHAVAALRNAVSTTESVSSITTGTRRQGRSFAVVFVPHVCGGSQ